MQWETDAPMTGSAAFLSQHTPECGVGLRPKDNM